MKTRIIQTRFWDDDVVERVSPEAKLVWVFLLTNKHLGMTNYVKIPDSIILEATGLTIQKLEKVKMELEGTRKIFFHGKWIFIPNLERENKYKNSPSNTTPYEKELRNVDNSVKAYFDRVYSSVDSTVDSSADSTQNSKIRNQKSKIKNTDGEKKEIETVIFTWNQSMGTNLSSSRAWATNFQKWREDFELERILQAIKNIPKHEWLKDKATPVIFFRTDKDWIDQCLNLGAAPGKPVEIPTDFY